MNTKRATRTQISGGRGQLGHQARSTYIRKVGDGLYEYGWAKAKVNFRKKEVFEPVGYVATVPEAERKRQALESSGTFDSTR